MYKGLHEPDTNLLTGFMSTFKAIGPESTLKYTQKAQACRERVRVDCFFSQIHRTVRPCLFLKSAVDQSLLVIFSIF